MKDINNENKEFIGFGELISSNLHNNQNSIFEEENENKSKENILIESKEPKEMKEQEEIKEQEEKKEPKEMKYNFLKITAISTLLIGSVYLSKDNIYKMISEEEIKEQKNIVKKEEKEKINILTKKIKEEDTYKYIKKVKLGEYLNTKNTTLYRLATHINKMKEDEKLENQLKENINKLGSIKNISEYLIHINKEIDYKNINSNTLVNIDLSTKTIESFLDKNKIVLKKPQEKIVKVSNLKEIKKKLNLKEEQLGKNLITMKKVEDLVKELKEETKKQKEQINKLVLLQKEEKRKYKEEIDKKNKELINMNIKLESKKIDTKPFDKKIFKLTQENKLLNNKLKLTEKKLEKYITISQTKSIKISDLERDIKEKEKMFFKREEELKRKITINNNPITEKEEIISIKQEIPMEEKIENPNYKEENKLEKWSNDVNSLFKY